MFLKILSPICDFYAVYQYKNKNKRKTQKIFKNFFGRMIQIKADDIMSLKTLKLKGINIAAIHLIQWMDPIRRYIISSIAEKNDRRTV